MYREPEEEYFLQHLAVKFRHGANLHVWAQSYMAISFPLVRFEPVKARQVNKVRIKAETNDFQVYAKQVLWGSLQDYVVRARR